MNSKPPLRKRVARWIGFLIVTVIVLLYLAMPIGLGAATVALHTGAFSRYPAEYEQRVIEFFEAGGLN